MSCNPSLGLDVLSRLIGMWEITAIKRLGVYQSDEAVGPFFGKLTYSPYKPPSSEKDPSAAHLVWIDFLHERLLCLKHTDKNVIDLLVQFVCVFHTHMGKFRYWVSCLNLATDSTSNPGQYFSACYRSCSK